MAYVRSFVIFFSIVFGIAIARDCTTNKEGLELIERYEGFRANFYNDPVGIKTIGYGHACHSSDCSKLKPPLSKKQAEDLLKSDLKSFEKCINDNTKVDLNSNQFSALVSFAFNLGCGSYQQSTLRKKINSKDFSGAANEFGKWVHAGGKVLPGLVKRRASEKALFKKKGAAC